ncbi:hypothetical protein B0H13DRAFT_853654 [Mycena leptocephala]|nr:hypothetical protein B0H13DRAFT_853654 [Mycena leptocephala]
MRSANGVHLRIPAFDGHQWSRLHCRYTSYDHQGTLHQWQRRPQVYSDFYTCPLGIICDGCWRSIVVQDFKDIQRDPNHMYCHSAASVQYLTTSIICVIGLGIALCMTAWTAVILCRNWSLFRKLSTQTSERELRLSSLIRVMLFTMMTTIGFGLGTSGASPNIDGAHSHIWGTLLPILPFLCGIAFGTQKDILRCWMFWKWGSGAVTPVHNSKHQGAEVAV